MADVTPPGEGPPSIGHAVDLKQVGSKPAPGWPLGALNPGLRVKAGDSVTAPVMCPAPGTLLLVDTPDGQVEIAIANGPRYVLVSAAAGMKLPAGIGANSFVTFDKDGRLLPASPELTQAGLVGPVAPVEDPAEDPEIVEQMIELIKLGALTPDYIMKTFLNKSGPAPETSEQKARRKQLEEQAAQLLEQARQREAARGGGNRPPAVPDSVRTGRAIELD